MDWESEESSECFRWLWQHSSVGCAIVGLDMRVEEANQHFASQLGYTTTQLQGKHVDDITAGRDRGSGVDEIQRVVDGLLPFFHQDKHYQTRGGSIRCAEVFSYPIRDSRGELVRFFSVVLFDDGVKQSLSVDDLEKIRQLEGEVESMREVLLAMVGRGKSETTIISGSTNSAGRSGVSVGNNDAKLILWVGIAICGFAIALAALALGGAFSATDGNRSIEVRGNQQQTESEK